MNRPWQVYLIALWIFITMTMHVGLIFSVVSAVTSWMLGQYPPDQKYSWFGLLTVIPAISFLVITLAELIWLHSVGIIASIILLVVGCVFWLVVLFGSSSVIYSGEPISSAILIKVFKDFYPPILNLVCIWYLSRRTFRDYCKRFVEEKRLELLRRYTQEQLRKKY